MLFSGIREDLELGILFLHFNKDLMRAVGTSAVRNYEPRIGVLALKYRVPGGYHFLDVVLFIVCRHDNI